VRERACRGLYSSPSPEPFGPLRFPGREASIGTRKPPGRAPNGRVDVVFYDRTCDLQANVKDCVTLSSSTDGGLTWSDTALTSTGFNGDHFHACLAFSVGDCGRTFLGDYIAVESNNSTAQVLYTGNGENAMDVFSVHAGF
jgi:hypothetical protein